jgi:transcriptional regulator GlxA family with amidase domain
MKHITIVVPEGQNNLSSIVGTYKVFTRANAYWKENNGKELFTIQLAGISKKVEFHEGLFTVKPHTNISMIDKTNLIVIPSLNHNYQKAVKGNKVLVDWIAKQYKEGAEIASICTGAFLLASSGLLDGKNCSTHWAAAEHFRTMFPEVNLRTDKLITDENGIYTNGGAFSFLNLVIYLVEKFFDRETAIFCSKVFQIDIERASQSPFHIFQVQKDHGDELISKAQTYMEENLSEKIHFEELASKLATSRRNFDRRFIKATGNTPVEYLQRVKVEAAKRTLEKGRKSIFEVMNDVGYSDDKAFREIFKKITGVSPLDYKARYHKETVFIQA